MVDVVKKICTSLKTPQWHGVNEKVFFSESLGVI